MKRSTDPFEVVADAEKRPVSLRLSGRTYRVEEVLSTWLVEGHWWKGEVRRRYFRVLTSHGVVEICRSGDTWLFVRALD